MREIYDFLYKGGPVMIPIMLLSVIALAIFLERMWILRRSLIAPEGFVDKVQGLLRTGKRQESILLCQSNPTPLSRVLLTIIGSENASNDEIMELVEETGKREAAKIGRYIDALGTIAAVEPLLGLLGTVTGLIRAFQQVVFYAGEGAVDPGRLASGIWEALITTAAGLIIGIPCYIGYKYLAARADFLTTKLEEASASVFHLHKYHKDEIAPAAVGEAVLQTGGKV
jgi:biopolymer transport protein ExbB